MFLLNLPYKLMYFYCVAQELKNIANDQRFNFQILNGFINRMYRGTMNNRKIRK